jgi:hypothetical protein
VLASIYGHLGDTDAGTLELAKFREESKASLSDLAAIWFHKPAHNGIFFDGIRKL